MQFEILEIVSGPRPIDDLEEIAALLSGHRLDEMLDAVPTEPERLRKGWQALRSMRRDPASSGSAEAARWIACRRP